MMIFNLFQSSGKNSKVLCTLHVLLSLQGIGAAAYANSEAYEGKPRHATGLRTFTENTQLKKQPCCSEGAFYENKIFYNFNYMLTTTLGEKLKYDYGITLFYCTFIPVIDVLAFGGDATICGCDCWTAHGASEYELCPSENLPCRCIYKDTDKGKNPPSTCDPPKSGRDLQSEEKSNRNGTKRDSVTEDLCANIYTVIKKAACDDFDGGVKFYEVEGIKIFPVDICAFDCYHTHGVRDKAKAPYGRCCTLDDEEDAKKKCVCLK